ncbi:MAG: DUF488 family protein [Spirochaetales bacterium]|nr:DUF488 family protein [Spirochaetales bacterium]
MNRVSLKRIYEPPSENDGRRYLVDRLWPRGVSHERASLTDWLKDVAPSVELRKWYGHDPTRWEEFRLHYFEELERNLVAVEFLRDEARRGPITLVFAAKNEEFSHARALKEFLEREFPLA